jgi:hypothetical protein
VHSEDSAQARTAPVVAVGTRITHVDDKRLSYGSYQKIRTRNVAERDGEALHAPTGSQRGNSRIRDSPQAIPDPC